VLLVEVGERTWAVPAEWVRGVVRPVATSPLAGAPAWVTGVASVRGAVLPVADLAARAGVAAPDAAHGAWWVIVEHGTRAAALAGARVRAVEPATMEPATIEPATTEPAPGEPATGDRPAAAVGLPGAGAARLWGEGEVPPPPVPVLDVAAVLSEVHDDGG
jgi:purine-binding chemotaxis protein CheW